VNAFRVIEPLQHASTAAHELARRLASEVANLDKALKEFTELEGFRSVTAVTYGSLNTVCLEIKLAIRKENDGHEFFEARRAQIRTWLAEHRAERPHLRIQFNFIGNHPENRDQQIMYRSENL